MDEGVARESEAAETGNDEIRDDEITEDMENGEFKFESVGERLRKTRESKALSLADIAARTRVPERHLLAIEESRFADLPGRTYAVGFTKSYAQTVDLPVDELAAEFRAEMEAAGIGGYRMGQNYEPEEPARIPTARTAFIAAGIGIAVLIAGFGIWRGFFFPGADLNIADGTGLLAGDTQSPAPSSGENSGIQVEPDRQPDGSITAPTSGDVVFTATADRIWVKFYDGSGQQLMQKEMALGERYIVPADAVNPQIWTARPDALAITIGDTAIPPLGTAERIIKDVPVNAQALLARVNGSGNTDSLDNSDDGASDN